MQEFNVSIFVARGLPMHRVTTMAHQRVLSCAARSQGQCKSVLLWVGTPMLEHKLTEELRHQLD